MRAIKAFWGVGRRAQATHQAIGMNEPRNPSNIKLNYAWVKRTPALDILHNP